jgi:hypothetical protein
VTTLADSGPGSLRQAILDANATPGDDTITCAVTGTINLASALPDLYSNIDMEGPGAASLTVRRSQSLYTPPYYRIFMVGSGANVVLSGLTIANGDPGPGQDGGGIVNSGVLTLNNATVSGNHAVSAQYGDAHGAGIYNVGTLTLNNTTVSGNTLDDGDQTYGGGIYSSGTLTLNCSTVSDNFANAETQSYGGGIYNVGTLAVNDSTVSGNNAGRGGIYNVGTLMLNNSSVSGNDADEFGGGIVNDSTLTLNNSTVTGNRADLFDGGGIANVGTATLNNSTVSDNSTGYSGGGGISNYGTLTLNNSTVSGNTARRTMFGGFAGGITNFAFGSSTVLLLSSTIASNTVIGTDRTASQIYNGRPNGGTGQGIVQCRNTILSGSGTRPNLAADTGGTFVSQGYNLSSDDGSGFLTGPGDLTNTDPLLGPLRDNGGPTRTHALLAGSPALTTGDPNELGNTDQRGVLRSGGVNIGAYQASATAFLLTAPDTVQSGVPLDVTVTGVDPFGQVALGYTGTVTFSTTDPDPTVVLPADYPFTLHDGGVHTFTDTGLGEPEPQQPGRAALPNRPAEAGGGVLAPRPGRPQAPGGRFPHGPRSPERPRDRIHEPGQPAARHRPAEGGGGRLRRRAGYF